MTERYRSERCQLWGQRRPVGFGAAVGTVAGVLFASGASASSRVRSDSWAGAWTGIPAVTAASALVGAALGVLVGWIGARWMRRIGAAVPMGTRPVVLRRARLAARTGAPAGDREADRTAARLLRAPAGLPRPGAPFAVLGVSLIVVMGARWGAGTGTEPALVRTVHVTGAALFTGLLALWPWLTPRRATLRARLLGRGGGGGWGGGRHDGRDDRTLGGPAQGAQGVQGAQRGAGRRAR